MKQDKIKLIFTADSKNESLARNIIACYALRLEPSISQISDVKTAVSEAVTNAIVHGYPDSDGVIELEAEIVERELHIIIRDFGIGIEDVDKAIEPFFTTKIEEERSGMGFVIMKSFMDGFDVRSEKGVGTSIYMTKKF